MLTDKEQAERDLIVRTIKKNKKASLWVIASMLGVNKRTLCKRMDSYLINRPTRRPSKTCIFNDDLSVIKWRVYTLGCPKTKHVKYIGITQFPNHRKRHHLTGGHLESSTWLQELRREKLQPVFTVIDSCYSKAMAKYLENDWIEYFRESGEPIINKQLNILV